MQSISISRIKREIELLSKEPPQGVCAWPLGDDFRVFEVEIESPDGYPLQTTFKLQAILPDRYPFVPPNVTFKSPTHHPNVDSCGRICSDVLKLPPSGCWSPAMNLPTVFAALRLLIGEPNPDDPLEHAIADEYVNNPTEYNSKVIETCLGAGKKKTEVVPQQTTKEAESSSTPSENVIPPPIKLVTTKKRVLNLQKPKPLKKTKE